jgi:hypothetical protein
MFFGNFFQLSPPRPAARASAAVKGFECDAVRLVQDERLLRLLETHHEFVAVVSEALGLDTRDRQVAALVLKVFSFEGCRFVGVFVARHVRVLSCQFVSISVAPKRMPGRVVAFHQTTLLIPVAETSDFT